MDRLSRITVAITGASGAIYALRTIRGLLIGGARLDLIVSDLGWMLLREEGGFEGKRSELGDYLVEQYGKDVQGKEITLHAYEDLATSIASGSVRSAGMVIVPCSMKTLAGVANGYASNLIERSADVTLKERRTLVLVPRETPLNLVHMKNLVAAAEAGAAIVPAMPAFYQRPQTFEDLADFIAGRVLNLLGIPHTLFPTWKGE